MKWFVSLFTALTLGGGGMYAADKAQDPYLDKETHYELPIKSDIPQGERVEIHKDKAQMDLIGWNSEYKISIIPQIPTAQLGGADRPFTTAANRPLLSKKMEFKSGDVTAFIEPKEGTDNEFDIDFTLDSKPDTNVFEYKIEGVEEFDFFYQPELTPAEIAEGAERPENVVGSYAVYHKKKANHRSGSTNYATGKAFHVFRPKAIDANGAEVWAELHYVSGMLNVTVPQKFLDAAVYPVRVDPTFGYTTAGGSTLTTIGNDDVKVAGMSSPLTATTGDTVTSYSFYGRSTGGDSETLLMTSYTQVTLQPSALLAAGTSLTIETTTQWYTSGTVSQSLTNGTIYCVAAGFGSLSTSGSELTLHYDAGTNPGRFNSSSVALTDPFAVSGTDSGRHYSWYATYTAPAVASPSSGAQLIIQGGGQVILPVNGGGQLIIP